MNGLSRALSLFEPVSVETWIFQTALNRPADALALLQNAESAGQPDLIPYLAGPGKWMRGQLPLIYANLAKADPDVPLACRPYLKTAALRERKRYAMFLKGLRAAIEALNGAGRPYCVVKGVAVAHTAYANPVLRHSHDVDVVVRDADRATMAQALCAAGFRRMSPPDPWDGSLRLDHPSGLPVNLHTQPVQGDQRFDADWLLQDAQSIETEAGTFPVPSPAHRILHAWLHRLGTDRYERQVWVPDTVLDLRRLGAEDVDRMNAELSRHCLPEAQAAVRYLAAQIDDLSVLDRLRFSSATRWGAGSAPQRARLMDRAQTQGDANAFKSRLGPITRAAYLYDYLMPPRGFFGGNHTAPLWSLRLQRLIRAGRRRMGATR